jgi:hypothetical protein
MADMNKIRASYFARLERRNAKFSKPDVGNDMRLPKYRGLSSPTFRTLRDAGVDIDYKAYRNAYQAWRLALRRGHSYDLISYVKRPKYQRQGDKKPKGYHVQRRILDLAMATPKWVDKEAIIAFYLKRPTGMTVDHIMPIRGEISCGLHVPWNLQYLTLTQNIAKGNRIV